MYELRELDEKIDKSSLKMAARHPMGICEAVLAARAEEDDKL
jgi:hypothetical protein